MTCPRCGSPEGTEGCCVGDAVLTAQAWAQACELVDALTALTDMLRALATVEEREL